MGRYVQPHTMHAVLEACVWYAGHMQTVLCPFPLMMAYTHELDSMESQEPEMLASLRRVDACSHMFQATRRQMQKKL